MHRQISLDSILLFCLVLPFIMTYRISPTETPYVLFGVIFFGLLSYLLLDLVRLKDKTYFRLKLILLSAISVVVIGSAFVSAIIVRHQTHPIYMIHDIVLQQESAIRFLLDGKNPYKETYSETPLQLWHYSDKEVNPALYHFVMEPFYLMFAVPFYFVSNHTIGFFDGRIPLLILFAIAAVIGSIIIKDQKQRFLFIILFLFNPAMLPYTLEGRSDMFMFGFFIVSLWLMYLKKPVLSAIPMALAFSVKQSIWPILPFYLAFLLFTAKKKSNVVYSMLLFSAVFLLITGPFLLWDAKAFLDSTVYYLSGQTTYSYPISGYGFSRVLLESGFIKTAKTYYPFIIWQAVFGVPLMIWLTSYLKKNPTVRRLILVYGIFLFVYWYFSRYFHNSHLGYLSMIFITSYFWPEEKNSS